jgi:uncharacterized protein (TIGR02996 family)
MRKFTYSDAKSHKFWNIERNGASFTVTYGRQGTAGTSQTKTFADEAAAIKEHDKLVAEKVKKGYVEEGASTPATAGSLSEALEQAILANLDDLAAHMAYADWLHDQGNPRGDLIQVQLALEDPSKSEKERKALQKQEKQLLEAHARQWLGSLAEPILDGKVNGLDFEDEPEATHTFQRGWLDSLKVSSYSCEYLRAIARAPEMRSVRVLHLESNTYEDEWEPGPDVPEDAEQPGCHPLAASNNLGNVRTFILGELEDDEYRNCHTDGEGAVGAIKKMPRLEELRLLAHRVDTAELFGLKTLNSLRILQVDHCHEYPLKRLGANPSLGNLTTLIIHPHAIEEDEAYIRLEGLRSIARSPHLKSLSHLQLRLADFGDAGIEEIISSGLIKRLKVLDLMHGRVTDAGARMLAACPDVKNLERLNLTGNCLTAEGISELSQVVPGLVAQSQWTPTGDEFGDSEYLYHGDIE